MDYLKRIIELEKQARCLEAEIAALRAEFENPENFRTVSAFSKEGLRNAIIPTKGTDATANGANAAANGANAVANGVNAAENGMQAVVQGANAAANGLAAAENGRTAEANGRAANAYTSDKSNAEKTIAYAAAASNSEKAPGAKKAEPKKKLTLEEIVGGKFMGIIAAGLVFIGLLLFGTMVYEALGDGAKVALLYLVSFVLLGGGLLLHKKKSSYFSLSLVGCGFGALYLTIFMTRVLFCLISVEGMYGMIFFWVIGTGLFVFKYRSKMVAFLELCGITASVLLGASAYETTGEFVFLVVYFIIMSAFYYWVVILRFLPKDAEKSSVALYLVTILLQAIQLMVLAFQFQDWYRGTRFELGLLLTVALTAYTLAIPLAHHLRERRENGLPLFPSIRLLKEGNARVISQSDECLEWLLWGIYQVFGMVIFTVLWGELDIGGTELECCTILVLSILLWLITELLGQYGTESAAAAVVLGFGTVIIAQMLDFAGCAVMMLLVTVLFLCFGFFGNKNDGNKRVYGKSLLKCLSLVGSVVTFFYAFDHWRDDYIGAPALVLLLAIAIVLAVLVLLYLGKGEWSGVLYQQSGADALKIVAYLIFLGEVFFFVGQFASLIGGYGYEDEYITVFFAVLAAAIVNGVAYYSSFANKLYEQGTKDKVLDFILTMVNQGLWIGTMFLMHEANGEDNTLMLALLIGMGLYLCVSGMRRWYYQSKERKLLGVCLGVRVTIYVLCVLALLHDIPGFVISVVLILLALGAVIAGFLIKLSSLRVYGLVMAMVAILKLLMLDVSHDNSLQTVFCFIIAGVLCFCINYVYNKVKKYMEE